MQFKVKKHLGLGLCIPAIVFLCNPVVAFTDVLPDCIGFLLLCVGLSQAADLNAHLADALRGFRIMLGISTVSFILHFWVDTNVSEMNATGLEDRPMQLLLWTFVFAVLQCLFLIPAMRNFFLGLGALGERYGIDAVSRSRSRHPRWEKLASFTSAFIFLQALLSTLPEFSALTTFEFREEKLPFDWYQFIGLFRIVAVIIGILLAVLWLVRTLRFLAAFPAAKESMKRMEEYYAANVLPDVTRFFLRRYVFAFIFLMVGIVFTIHLRMDERSVFPAYVAAFLLVAGVLLLGDRVNARRLPLLLSAGALALISIVNLWMGNRYFAEYYTADYSLYDHTAHVQYLLFCGVQILQAIAILLTVLLLLRILFRFFKDTLAESYEGNEALSHRATERLHRTYRIRTVLVFSCFALTFAATVTEIILGVYFPKVFWIPFVLSVVATCAFCALLFSVIEQLRLQHASERVQKTDRAERK